MLRRLKYLLTIFKEAFGANALYAFNLSTAGLPAFIVGKLLNKKTLIRVRNEAHRFAQSYHKKLRGEAFIG